MLVEKPHLHAISSIVSVELLKSDLALLSLIVIRYSFGLYPVCS